MKMSDARALREANKALNNQPRKATKYLMMPLNLASALVAVAVEWAKGRQK